VIVVGAAPGEGTVSENVDTAGVAGGDRAVGVPPPGTAAQNPPDARGVDPEGTDAGPAVGRGTPSSVSSASVSSADHAARAQTDLVIVTGLSGGGRSTVARALENVGYYVVDNLPQALMLDMAELASQAGGAAKRTAMVLDVRSRAFSTDLSGAVAALRASGFSPRVLFVDAEDEVLIRRFESVRRSHPLQGNGRLADGISAERQLLAEARDTADVLIDTSHLNVNQLRNRVEELFGGEDSRRIRVTVLSFGFKYGLPPDADFVVDARFLPNPFWDPDLRDLTGKDEAVSHYVLSQVGASAFVDTYARLITATSPGFEREGKRYLTVAVGCTGGKHRSVAIAEELTRRLRDQRVVVAAQHRDLGRE
jgi:RNase adapter protein RapZ